MGPLQIESITFSNFKALVNTTLPLGRFTLIVGPNGSGKSTALQAIASLGSRSANSIHFDRFLAAGMRTNKSVCPKITAQWDSPRRIATSLRWIATTNLGIENTVQFGTLPEITDAVATFLARIRVFARILP